MKKTLEDVPLEKISSIQWSSGIALGQVTIFASGNKAEIGRVAKKDARRARARCNLRRPEGRVAPARSARTSPPRPRHTRPRLRSSPPLTGAARGESLKELRNGRRAG